MKKRTRRILFRNDIYVMKSRMHGYGVFAGKKIRKGEKIEECYIIFSRGGDRKLENYYFDAKGKYATFLGYGAIYNHADEPNTDYTIGINKCIATFKAKRTIKKGEELTITYGEGWFADRRLKPKLPK